jgi:hypothetical protein
MKITILFAAAFTLACVSAQAQMGRTLKECIDKLGAFQSQESIEGNRTSYKWSSEEVAPLEIIFMRGNPQASRVIMEINNKTATLADFTKFVKVVCPGYTWHDTHPYNGANFALLSNGSSVYWGGWGDHWISAWTEADDEAAKKE